MLDFKGKRFSVLGLGKSGCAAARLLRHLGAEVFASEAKDLSEVQDVVEGLRLEGIDLETGGHTTRVLDKADYIIVSPGIPLKIPIISLAKKRNIPVLGEVELAYKASRSKKIIGITGTNGKTTVTVLVGEILRRAGKEVDVSGNIGRPFAEAVEGISSETFLVVELSSFQLETIEEFRPLISVLLNLTEDHLKRYNNFKEYIEAKKRIFKNQLEKDFCVLNLDDPVLAKIKQECKAKIFPFSRRQRLDEGVYIEDGWITFKRLGEKIRVSPVYEIKIPGAHNLENVLSSVAVCVLLGIEKGPISDAITSFHGLPHRIELVREHRGVRYINDSKATNLDSVVMALETFHSPIILIAGGEDKGFDLSRLVPYVKEKVKTLILFGEIRYRMREVLGDVVKTHIVSSMEGAVSLSSELSCPGDTVLLSPGGSSHDMYRDFEERGNHFTHLVRSLK